MMYDNYDKVTKKHREAKIVSLYNPIAFLFCWSHQGRLLAAALAAISAGIVPLALVALISAAQNTAAQILGLFCWHLVFESRGGVGANGGMASNEEEQQKILDNLHCLA